MKETIRYLREKSSLSKNQVAAHWEISLQTYIATLPPVSLSKLNPRTSPAEKPTIHSLLHTGGA